MGIYTDKIQNMQWSYSRLSCYERCKYAFYLQYVLKDFDEYPLENNFWAENGTAVHETLAAIFSGKIEPADAEDYYIDLYNQEVIYRQKASTVSRTFDICSTYFREGSFDWIKGYDVLGVELKTKLKYQGYNFIGFIDLLLKRKDNGKIILLDHKSSESFFRMDGKLKGGHGGEMFYEYRRQMYLYCMAVKEIYGFFPDSIVWNHFKEQTRVKGELNQVGKFSIIPFDEKDYNDTMDWVFQTIHSAEEEESFDPPPNEELDKNWFYCTNLCAFRHSCEYCLDKWHMKNSF